MSLGGFENLAGRHALGRLGLVEGIAMGDGRKVDFARARREITRIVNVSTTNIHYTYATLKTK